VPQFRLLFEPVLVAFAASLALVAARVIIAVAVRWARSRSSRRARVLALLVGPILGQTTRTSRCTWPRP